MIFNGRKNILHFYLIPRLFFWFFLLFCDSFEIVHFYIRLYFKFFKCAKKKYTCITPFFYGLLVIFFEIMNVYRYIDYILHSFMIKIKNILHGIEYDYSFFLPVWITTYVLYQCTNHNDDCFWIEYDWPKNVIIRINVFIF